MPRNRAPNTAADAATRMPSAGATAAERSTPGGSRGCGVRRACQAYAPPAAAVARNPSAVAAVQPVSGSATSVYTRDARASARRSAPGRSSPGAGTRFGSGIRTTSARTPISSAGATVRKKTERQPSWSVSAPPTSGPAAAATAMALVRIAIGTPIRSGG